MGFPYHSFDCDLLQMYLRKCKIILSTFNFIRRHIFGILFTINGYKSCHIPHTKYPTVALDTKFWAFGEFQWHFFNVVSDGINWSKKGG